MAEHPAGGPGDRLCPETDWRRRKVKIPSHSRSRQRRWLHRCRRRKSTAGPYSHRQRNDTGKAERCSRAPWMWKLGMPLRQSPHCTIQRHRKMRKRKSPCASKPQRARTSSWRDTETSREAGWRQGLLDTNLRVHINTYLFRARGVRRLGADLQRRNATGLGGVTYWQNLQRSPLSSPYAFAEQPQIIQISGRRWRL